MTTTPPDGRLDGPARFRVETRDPLANVLCEVAEERIAQDAKFGEQNHADGTGPDVLWPASGTMAHVAAVMKAQCKASGKPGGEGDTWFKVLAEEVAEAGAEADPVALRAELVQVAAVAVAWIQAIDRRVAEPNLDVPDPRGEVNDALFEAGAAAADMAAEEASL